VQGDEAHRLNNQTSNGKEGDHGPSYAEDLLEFPGKVSEVKERKRVYLHRT